MILYHRTNEKAFKSIKREGFRDGTGTYMTDREFSGVWVSDRPLDDNEGAFGNVVLKLNVDIPEEEIAYWEWVEEVERNYREFLIPAEKLNPRIRSMKVIKDNPDPPVPYPEYIW